MTRILLTGAGSGAANSLMRDLRAGDSHLYFVGCSANRFALTKSPADRNYLVDPRDHPGYVDSLRRIVVKERIDFLIPTSDDDVMVIARSRRALPVRVFLPSVETVEQCQDKYRRREHARSRNLGTSNARSRLSAAGPCGVGRAAGRGRRARLPW